MPVALDTVINNIIVMESGSYLEAMWKQRKKLGSNKFCKWS